MIKSGLFFSMLALLFSNTLFATQTSAKWQLTQLTEKKQFEVKLECESAPSTGVFQNCWLMLKHLDETIESASVFLNGGMPEHHHGLPTAPVVSWSKASHAYIIEGLKFSMPGYWELNFSIEAEELPKDQTTFSLNIK
jgi:hypothetical protein